MESAQSDRAAVPSPLPASARRERLRFADFRFTRTPAGQCTAEVHLEWISGERYIGRATGQSSELADLRIVGEATLRALEEFSGGTYHFDIFGVKLVRAFDANVIIAAVSVKGGEGPRRLLGAQLAEREPLNAAVLAVLSATNRLLGNFVATR